MAFDVFSRENMLKANKIWELIRLNFFSHEIIVIFKHPFMTFMTWILELYQMGLNIWIMFSAFNHFFITIFLAVHSYLGRWCMMLNKNKSVSPSRQILLPLSPRCTSAHYGNIWTLNWAVDLDLCIGHSFLSVDVGLPEKTFFISFL